ncbi:fasciclin domain-containing protein [Pontibacter sp. E15-1]|uniref:fasciclin domain-containing protein n=1 Tax=Pontibacter sp. E15-1 TaxID=2919918 RepID=UPI001F4F82B5|nr:fasciclin domain-containing protein [Pontibacter sp. E15-1]MCJ8165934.1 fasciclin domain-containing protein [Pontibacter sp. E15-1]
MKNRNESGNILVKLTAACLLMVTVLWGCQEEYLETSTTTDVNMTGYFEKNQEQFSEFSKILELTGNAGYLGAYGAYTLFAPNNDAVRLYMQDKGVSAVDQLELEELKKVVKFHLIEDTISTSLFTDGKLPKITMLGQYLITGAVNEDGKSRINVNRQAKVVQGNIKVGNGIIHSIDRVLQPATRTVAELVADNPSYSIFTQALKETGYYEKLNALYLDEANTKRAWYTLLAQTDAVYSNMGIGSYEALKEEYSDTGNPAAEGDSLNLYVAYHILPDNKYVADIVTAPSHATLAPLEVLTTKLKGDSVLINEDTFAGILEPGAPIDRAASDNSGTNGVLHAITKNIAIKVRKPVRVDFDVADQPELRVMPQWRSATPTSTNLGISQLKDVKLEGGTDGGDFKYTTVPSSESNTRVYNDFLEIYLRPAVVKSIEFKTPVLVKGKYKVWIAYRRLGTTIQTFFDGKPLQRTINMSEYWPNGVPEGDLLAQGWKRYTTAPENNSFARLAGTIEVETTDRHSIKLVGLVNLSRQWIQLDMIQFIPVDQDQLWPKLDRDGTPVFEE